MIQKNKAVIPSVARPLRMFGTNTTRFHMEITVIFFLTTVDFIIYQQIFTQCWGSGYGGWAQNYGVLDWGFGWSIEWIHSYDKFTQKFLVKLFLVTNWCCLFPCSPNFFCIFFLHTFKYNSRSTQISQHSHLSKATHLPNQ